MVYSGSTFVVKKMMRCVFSFQLRGNAGSHDLPFAVETLTALTKLTKEG